MKSFESLTLALEGWLDTDLCDLPDDLRKRVERELLPMPWDRLSVQQRHSLALQQDYQHDPAMEEDRTFWWEFFERKRALEGRITECENVAAPTIGDMVQRECRLTELRRELAHMDRQERRTSAPYYPAPKHPETENEDPPASQGVQLEYIAYPKAMQILAVRLNATPEELAAWVWNGPLDNGIAAYVNANELDPPPRFHFGLGDGGGKDHDYVSPLMACWFRADEIARFKPAQRFITGSALIQRWSDRPGLKPVAFIQAKIRESRLSDAHPIYGMTQGSLPTDDSFPPLTTGLFRLSDVAAIEAEDFPMDWDRSVCSLSSLDSGNEQEAEPDAAIFPSANVSVRLAAPLLVEPIKRLNAGKTGAADTERITSASPCAVFRAMQNLRADELSITFVGDKSDGILGANNMLEVTARGETRRVALATLDLVDRRKGSLNSQGVILLGMALGRRLTHTGPDAAKMKRLREVLRRHFGLTGDPFQSHRRGNGWLPHFQIFDKRGVADERAKREGERRTESYDGLVERGVEVAQFGQSEREFNDEDDQAGNWLKKNDPGVST